MVSRRCDYADPEKANSTRRDQNKEAGTEQAGRASSRNTDQQSYLPSYLPPFPGYGPPELLCFGAELRSRPGIRCLPLVMRSQSAYIARRSLQASALNSGVAAPRPLSFKKNMHLARMVLEVFQLLVESRAHIRDRSSSRAALLDKVGTLQCLVSHFPCCAHLIKRQPLRWCCEEAGDRL